MGYSTPFAEWTLLRREKPMNRGLPYNAAALFMIVSQFVAPVSAQTPGAQTPGTQSQEASSPAARPQSGIVQEQSPDQPQAQTVPAGAVPAREVILGTDYSSAKKWFPNPIPAYTSLRVAGPRLTNPPRVAQLMENGKLMLSLADAISLALEDNLAIAVERYTPWLDQVNLLRAKSGVNGLIPFDPTVTGTMNVQATNTPVNNPLFAGVVPTGAATPTQITPAAYTQHIANVNFQYTQYFHPGTEFQASLTNNRTSTNFGTFNLFNPDVQSVLTLQLTQPLLKGFGAPPNTRLIIEAKNTEKVGL
jgi:outer membrane protein